MVMRSKDRDCTPLDRGKSSVTVPYLAPGNRPLEPQALEVEFFPMEEVLHEKVKIH
jgi:hypothetical protein